MPADLLDVNVWGEAAFAAHPGHHSAQAVLLQATPAAPALFCRATQQSFLRLVSTPAICTTYQAASITNQDGLAALEAFQALPQVDLVDEPIGMDAYLAAFAISSFTRMVTLDQDFRQFFRAGLDLELFRADSHGGG